MGCADTAGVPAWLCAATPWCAWLRITREASSPPPARFDHLPLPACLECAGARCSHVSYPQARVEAHAGIRLWDTRTCKEVQHLTGHRLTVTQMEFSHDDRYLLSVSKDRQLCLFERRDGDAAGAGAGAGAGGGVPGYSLVVAVPKAHKRVIWSCRWDALCGCARVCVRSLTCMRACMSVYGSRSWSPADDMFVTGSRDGTVKSWFLGTTADGRRTIASAIVAKLATAVTAVAFSPVSGDAAFVLALGLESGDMTLVRGVRGEDATVKWSTALQFPPQLCHCAAVRRMVWRHKPGAGGLQLATCSADHSVRVFGVRGIASKE